MSFKEVKELRKAGKLDEALKKALSDFEVAKEGVETEMIAFEVNFKEHQSKELGTEKKRIQIPIGILWAKRSLAWVYHDFLKKYSTPESYNTFKENLIKVNELDLPEDEKMIFDNCAWQIGSTVFALQKEETVDFGKINELFKIIKNFHFTKPSEAYSFLYKAFHKGYQNWSNYLDFADWWNFENFRSEDYLKEKFNGKKIMAIAEQAYIAYSKKLLEGETIEKDGFILHGVVNKNKIKLFIPRLDEIIEKHPEYQYPPYFKAKLLLASGNDENVLSAFLPFAKQKRNDFWVWELMGEIFAEDKETQFACYCKALSLKTPEDFLVKLRQTFAALLIEKQMYDEAKTEIEKVIATRSKHEWRIPNQVSQWTGQNWFKSATADNNNKKLYLKHVRKAEEILFQDVPEEVVAVEFVNENKNILNFVKNKQKHGFFNYSEHLDKSQVGDILKVRFSGDGQNGFYKILTAKLANSAIETEAIKNFEGFLKVITPQNFGFAEDVFIEPKLIQDKNLVNGQAVKGKAILSFNKKKNEWGWKAIEINFT
jgi:hypothetical protein